MIHFIRHAESAYNKKTKQLKQKYGDQYKQTEKYVEQKFSPDLIDAGISQFGVQQCHILAQQLKLVDIEVVLVSPMHRALQTCSLLFKNHPSKPIIVAEPLFREVLSSSCDIGARIEQSIKKFCDIDFSKILDRQAWYIHTINKSQTKAQILQKLNGLASAERKSVAIKESLRLIKTIYYLEQKDPIKYKIQHDQMLPDYCQQKDIIKQYLQKYSKIAIISHSKTIKRLIGHRIQNGKLFSIPYGQIK